MDEPLLAAEAPPDASAPPSPSPCPARVDEVAKKTEEAGVSVPSSDCELKKEAEATDKTEEVSPAIKDGSKAGFFSWFVGGSGAKEAGQGSRGGKGGAKAGGHVLSSSGSGSGRGMGVLNNEQVVDIHSAPRPPPPAMTGSGGVGAEARRSFPSRVLATILGRKTLEKIVLERKTLEKANTGILLQRKTQISELIQCAEDFAGSCSDHRRLADPSANLAAALRDFASAENTATVSGLQEASVNLEKIASSGKIEEQLAGAAKKLSSEATALAGGGRPGDPDPPSDLGASTSSASTCSRSPEILFYLVIPGSVGLLPYLNATIPKDFQGFAAFVFGTVFSAATVGVLLVARAKDKTDLETAAILGALCFGAFSILVIIFLSVALAGGNLALICILTVIVVVMHSLVWVRK